MDSVLQLWPLRGKEGSDRSGTVASRALSSKPEGERQKEPCFQQARDSSHPLVQRKQGIPGTRSPTSNSMLALHQDNYNSNNHWPSNTYHISSIFIWSSHNHHNTGIAYFKAHPRVRDV